MARKAPVLAGIWRAAPNLWSDLTMVSFTNILVATDFSEPSDAAVATARRLAQAFGSTLHVLHVAGNVMAAAPGVEGYTTDFAGIQREVEDSARKRLDALVTEEDRRTLAARPVLLTSNSPAEAIASYARSAHIDLVVVGARGRGARGTELMGAVAERVVRTAPCPVLAVRPALVASIASAEPATAHA
jgi:nucleotide-binding universal stress UspA family protein